MVTKPTTILYSFERIPRALAARDQWLLWRWTLVNGRWTKVPVSPDSERDAPGQGMDATDRAKMLPLDAVLQLFESGDFDGIGFSIFADDPFTGVDCDGSVNGHGLVAEARAIVEAFATYTELSPSGTGVKLLALASKGTNKRCRTEDVDGFERIEVYDSGRWFAITGRAAQSPSPEPVEAQAALDRTMDKYLPERTPPASSPDGLIPEAFGSGMPSSVEDDEVLERMFSFRNGAKARRLFEEEPQEKSPSENDAALCGLLAFVCGPDSERIDRLFRQSARMRQKWDENRGGQTYGEMTIAFALDGRTDFYTPKDEEFDPVEQARRQDETIVREVMDRHEGDFLYVPEEKSPYWLRWDGNRWTRDAQAVYVRRALVALGRTFHREAENAETTEGAARLHSHGKRLGGATGVASVLKLMEPDFAIDPAALDADPDLLSVANGTLELRTDRERGTVAGRLRGPDPEDYITLGISVVYRADADTSEWDALGREWFPNDPEKWTFIEDVMGYHGLHGEAGRLGVVCYGDTAAGKSSGANAVSDTLGMLGYAGSMQDFAAKSGGGPHSGWARTFGARFGYVSEGGDGLQLDEGLVKRWLGGVPTSFEEKYEKQREAMPTMTPMFDTNHLPRVDGSDDAIFRRLPLVEWPRRFYKLPEDADLYEEAKRHGENPGVIDPALDVKLTTPAMQEAILASLVRALVRVDAAGGVTIPQSVQAATRHWQAQADPLAAFVEECLVRDPDSYEPVDDVLRAFNSFARDRGEPTVSSDYLSKTLGKRPYWIKRAKRYYESGPPGASTRKQRRSFLGVRLSLD